MESKFRSNVVSEGSWIGQSFFVISIRGYTPPLRATKIYTSSPIPPRGIWHTFARHEAYNYGLDPENRFLEGRVGVPSIVPYFEPDFCRRIPLKDSFSSSFLARTHYHTSLKSFFFSILSPTSRGEISWSVRNFLNFSGIENSIRKPIQIFSIDLRLVSQE